MAPAVTIEPFQHPRLAWEVSRRGAMAFAGGEEKEDEERESSGEKLPRRRRSARVYGRSRSCAQRSSRRSGRELQAERQWRRRVRAGGGRWRLGEGRGKG